MPIDPTNPRDPFNVAQLGIQGLQQTGTQARGFAGQLFDPQSQFFQNFRSFLSGVTPTQGTDTLLAGLQAGGDNFANSQFLAGKQNEAFQKRRADFLNTTTKGFASSALSTGAGLLGIAGQTAGQIGNIGSSFRSSQVQAQAQEGDIFDFLLSLGPGALAALLSSGGGAAGGAAGAAGTAAAVLPIAASDIRLKENIRKTGKSPSGINIYEFNYIGNPQRFKGVMAHEVPEANGEIGGIKYVDYSKIDVDFERL